MDRHEVRVTASLLAPRIRVRIGGRDTEHYVGILNREALKGGRKAWGPIGGAASVAACPTFSRLTVQYGVSLWDPRGHDLRLRVPRVHLDPVLEMLEEQIPLYAERDFRRELMQELAGRELQAISPEPILPSELVRQMDVRLVGAIRQPQNSGFVRSQRAGNGVATKRLLFLFDLGMPASTFDRLIQNTLLVREFDPADLPGLDDPPAEAILLEDGTERRGHLLRLDANPRAPRSTP